MPHQLLFSWNIWENCGGWFSDDWVCVEGNARLLGEREIHATSINPQSTTSARRSTSRGLQRSGGGKLSSPLACDVLGVQDVSPDLATTTVLLMMQLRQVEKRKWQQQEQPLAVREEDQLAMQLRLALAVQLRLALAVQLGLALAVQLGLVRAGWSWRWCFASSALALPVSGQAQQRA